MSCKIELINQTYEIGVSMKENPSLSFVEMDLYSLKYPFLLLKAEKRCLYLYVIVSVGLTQFLMRTTLLLLVYLYRILFLHLQLFGRISVIDPFTVEQKSE